MEGEELCRGYACDICLSAERRPRCTCALPLVASGRRTVRELGDDCKGGVVGKKGQTAGCASAVHVRLKVAEPRGGEEA